METIRKRSAAASADVAGSEVVQDGIGALCAESAVGAVDHIGEWGSCLRLLLGREACRYACDVLFLGVEVVCGIICSCFSVLWDAIGTNIHGHTATVVLFLSLGCSL